MLLTGIQITESRCTHVGILINSLQRTELSTFSKFALCYSYTTTISHSANQTPIAKNSTAEIKSRGKWFKQHVICYLLQKLTCHWENLKSTHRYYGLNSLWT